MRKHPTIFGLTVLAVLALVFNSAPAVFGQENAAGSPTLVMRFAIDPPAEQPLQVKETGSPAAGLGTKTYDAVNGEKPTSAQLAEFTGKYVSDELPGAIYTLSIKDGKLRLLIRNGITVFSDKALVLAWAQASGSESPEDNLLTPAFADAFFAFSGSIIVRFTRNQQNAVSGFTLTAGSSVRRLRFNKQ